MYFFPSAIFRTKSICLALFSAFSGAQACERRIHLEIKFGEQPFPKQKSISLNVSRSPIGFRQKAILMSSGQLFRGKKASPFKVLKRSALSSDTSFLERYLTVSRDSCSADIVLECLNSSTSLTMSDYSAEAHQDVVGKWDFLSPHISIVLLDPNKRYADLHFFGILAPFYWMRPYAYLEAKRIESAWVVI